MTSIATLNEQHILQKNIFLILFANGHYHTFLLNHIYRVDICNKVNVDSYFPSILQVAKHEINEPKYAMHLYHLRIF